MRQKTQLAGQFIEYQLKRTQRKTVGLTINQHGLQITAPPHFPVAEINALLQKKARWIQRQLTAWQNRTMLHSVDNTGKNASYRMLGRDWRPTLDIHGQLCMRPTDSGVDNQPVIDIRRHLQPEQLQHWMSDWYQQRAVACFSERIALFCTRLNIARPSFKLSQAKTRWGSCNNHGVIRLNWRLVQLPLHLIDYVIAHELCHLFEMNHSPAFWQRVAAIYPDYRTARRELSTYTLSG